MSAVAERDLLDIAASGVIPDSVEPVEAMRAWSLKDGKLVSLNQEAWVPCKPLQARCNSALADRYWWDVKRGGMSRDDAEAIAKQMNQYGAMSASLHFWGGGSSTPLGRCPHPTSVELPSGYGFVLECERHDAPNEGCQCGIYAATTREQLPDGAVQGKVKLWGKTIEGERGLRAEFAYPSEFVVPPKLADDPTLKAFGVPIIVQEKPKVTFTKDASPPTFKPKRRTGFKWAVAANVGAAAANFGLVLGHVL